MEKSTDETFSLRALRQELHDTAIIAQKATTRPDPAEACLVNIYPTGPRVGKRFRLGSRPALIGRSDDCEISIANYTVSRRQARIETNSEGEQIVTDLNSTNGTFVNNFRVQSKTLKDGDYLRVGDCIFRFLAGGNIEASYHEEIHRLTIIDPLTGLRNRRSLDAFLEQQIERAQWHHYPLAVVLFDIDHFKSINDRLGHLAGDFTLKDLAARAQEMTREEDLLARFGGEEFALVLPMTGLERAAVCAQRLLRAVEETPFTFEGQTYAVTISAGIGFLPSGGSTTAADLLRHADNRLYEAKSTGRNRVVYRCESEPTPGGRHDAPLPKPVALPLAVSPILAGESS